MSRVMLSVALVCSCAVGIVLAQSAGSRTGRKAARQRPPLTAEHTSAETPSRFPAAPVVQYAGQPDMVRVQALIATVSFGEAADDSPAGSLADALAERINAEGGAKKTPMPALATALDGVLKERGKTASIETLTGIELVSVAGQTAFVQIGHRKPRITGVTISQRGRTNQVQMENVGSIVRITPQVLPDASLVVAVNIERSDLAPEEEGPVIAELEDGSEIRSPQIDTLVAETTVTAADGQAVVVNDLVCSEQSSRKETFVIIRPLLIGASDDR